MNKPTPKAELIIELRSNNMLYIWTSSRDSADWVSENAPQYGNFYEQDMGHATLFVSPMYDVSEVIAYLRSYLEGQS